MVRFLLTLLITIGLVLVFLADSVQVENAKNVPVVSEATFVSAIQESCFTRTVLIDHLDEPMQLAIASDGRVFFIDRYGTVRVYEPIHNLVRKVNQIPVRTQHGTGLLGIALDPNFLENHYLYLYYTPATGPLRQRLARFTWRDSIEIKSEKVVLEIPWEDESNAHTGGSMAFDEQGNMFLSVGDNTAAFTEDGYASIDERPGRRLYDAQRTAANSNDLRGKILRIHIEDDGAYTIPSGNLFLPQPPTPSPAFQGKRGRTTSLQPLTSSLKKQRMSNNTPPLISGERQGVGLTRPEIYIMGCRNPYRLTYDKRTQILYWGDIGPDDGKDDKHGPRGYDEINQAASAGNYGWPYFIADNKPYCAYDFTTDRFGDFFTPAVPINRSVNNTGLQKLPPARKAMIWYPYNASAEFPGLGTGGRAAMVGAVYRPRPVQVHTTGFPEEYSEKLFIFDWMRNQINAISFDSLGNYQAMEPFMPGTNFKKPIDLKFAPDGTMYLLEYGEGFWVKNADASLVRIEYGADSRPAWRTNQNNLAKLSVNHPIGLQLISRSDCPNCHQLNRRTAAPSFLEIAARYHKKAGAVSQLAEKVLKGGAGAWGQHAMSAHPQLDQEEATEMVDYILSLKDSTNSSQWSLVIGH